VHISAPAANNNSSTGTTAAAAGLTHAFQNIANLINYQYGTALAAVPSPGPGGSVGVVPQAEINTIADILYTCVNSNGGSGSDGSACATMFALMPSLNGAAPTNTLQAAINLASNPTANVASLFALLSAQPAFAPVLTTAPNDWDIAIAYPFSVYPTGKTTSYPLFLTLDANDNVYVLNLDAASASAANLYAFTSSGSNTYVNQTAISTTYAKNNLHEIAADNTGDLWLSSNTGAVLELNAQTGAITATSTLTSTVKGTGAVAVDANNNVWFGRNNNSGATINEIPYVSGAFGSPIAMDTSSNSPAGIIDVAIDANQDIWFSSNTAGIIYVLSNSNTPQSPAYTSSATFSASGLTTTLSGTLPQGLALDSSSDGWIGTTSSAALNEITPVFNIGGTLTALPSTPTAAYTTTALNSAQYPEVDGNGVLWIPQLGGSGIAGFNTDTGNYVTTGLKPCIVQHSGNANTCAASGTIGAYGDARIARIDSTGSLWVANSDTQALLQIIGAAAPAWPLLATGLPGVMPQVSTSPLLTVTPTSLSFPSTIVVGASATAQTVTLTNTGSTVAILNGVSLTGANPGDFNFVDNCSSRISPGSTCTITLVFSPTAAGTRNANLAIANNSSVTPVTIPLSGTGGTVASSAALVNITTTAALSVPTRSNFAGVNMQLFSSGVSYEDQTMQALANTMNLGWVRFPAGTADDPYNWTTGDDTDAWVAQFSTYSAYSDMQTDIPIIRGKGGINFSDFASFIASQRTGPVSTAGTSPTHVIGVINTFTDTAASAGALAAAAVAAGIPVDLWELGNEPVYFSGFYPDAPTYLDAVKPYAAAIKAAVPTAKVAVYIKPDATNSWTTDTASYPTPFWDELYTHTYPNASQTVSSTSDQISFYNGFLLNNTNALVDSGLAPLFGSSMKIEWSEFNTNSLKSGLYNALYIAEFTMRLSSDTYVTNAGMHMLVGESTGLELAIGTTNDHITDCVNAYNAGHTINTSTMNFGYYVTPAGLALQIIDGVINTSSGVWPTAVSNSAAVSYISGSTTSTMPAIYAQAYSYAGTTHHVLLTNKAATPQLVAILQNGTQVMQTLTTRSIGGTDPTATNTASAPTKVALSTGTGTGTITLPSYSVMDVSWTQ